MHKLRGNSQLETPVPSEPTAALGTNELETDSAEDRPPNQRFLCSELSFKEKKQQNYILGESRTNHWILY